MSSRSLVPPRSDQKPCPSHRCQRPRVSHPGAMRRLQSSQSSLTFGRHLYQQNSRRPFGNHEHRPKARPRVACLRVARAHPLSRPSVEKRGVVDNVSAAAPLDLLVERKKVSHVSRPTALRLTQPRSHPATSRPRACPPHQPAPSTQNGTHLMLNRKLNCHVQTPGASSPRSSARVNPSWMILSRSTLHLSVW